MPTNSEIQKMVDDFVDSLKAQGITEIKYIPDLDGPGRGIETNKGNEETLNEDTVNEIDTLFRLVDHLRLPCGNTWLTLRGLRLRESIDE